MVVSEDHSTTTEFSLLVWPAGTNKNTAILYAAEQATTDWVLILDEDGLNGIDSRSRDLLLNISPDTLEIPLGPRGITPASLKAGLACYSPSEDPTAVKFLIPPFTLPSALLSEAHIVTTAGQPEDSVWASLGSLVANSRPDGAGGFALGSEDLKMDWCPTFTDIIDTVEDTLLPEPLDQDAVELPGEDALQPDITAEEDPEQMGRFALIFPSAKSLSQFSSAACRLQQAGHTISTYNYILQSEPEEFGPGNAMDCQLPFDVPNELLSLEAGLDSWINAMDLLPDVVIFAAEQDNSADLSSILERHSPSSIIIHLPPADFPFCDWMGTLTLEEWKRKPARPCHCRFAVH